MLRLFVTFLLCLACAPHAFAQGTIVDGDAAFIRALSPWDSSPDAGLTGVSSPSDDNHLVEMGWAFRVAGASQELFFPEPTTQSFVGADSLVQWNDVADLHAFRAVETAHVTDVDGPGGNAAAGIVEITMSITNLDPINPLTIDLFHMLDLDLQPVHSDDTVIAKSTASGPVMEFDDAGTNFATYYAERADAYLVRPFGAGDVGSLLADNTLSEFDNSGLPNGPFDFTGGVQWKARVIPPGGSMDFTVRLAVNDVLLNADLAIDVAHTPSPIIAGSDFDYVVTVHNNGPDPAPNALVLIDALPSGLTPVSTKGCAVDPSFAACDLGTILAGATRQFVLRVHADADTLGIVTLGATVASGDIHDPVPANDSTSYEAVVAAANADLSIDIIDSPDPVVGGQAVTYTVTVRNAGPLDAQNVEILTTVDAQIAGGGLVTVGCDEDPEGIHECHLGTIAAGAQKQFTLTSLVASNGNPLTGIVAQVTADQPDPNLENNNAHEDTTVLAPPALPELSLVKTNNVGGVAGIESGWTWRLRLQNAEAATAPATFNPGQRLLLDQLPNAAIAYGQFVNLTTTGGVTGTIACGIAQFDLQCIATSAVTVPPGATITAAITALPEDFGSYANPRAGGVCTGDPDQVVPELNDTNNSCANTVEAIDPLLFEDGFED